MRVAYYGELDPFSGGMDQQRNSLPSLVRDLKVLLLLYDVVLVQPGNLLEHALALPAFEQLAPFVRAGLLTTAAEPSLSSPRELIDGRVNLYMEKRARRHRERVQRGARETPSARQRRLEIEELRDRWVNLLPETWSLTRNVQAQTAGFADVVRQYCAETQRPSEATRWTLRVIDDSLQAGHGPPSRNELLARLGARREDLAPRELARVALVVQSAFLNAETSAHEPTTATGARAVCRLFPGRFASIVRRHELRLETLPMPAFDWSVDPPCVDRRLRSMGLELDRLLRMPLEELFAISQSPAWKRLRSLVAHGDTSRDARDVEEASRAVLTTLPDLRDPPERVTTLAAAAAATLPLTVLPAAWQLAAQAVLGLDVSGGAGPEVVTLDLTHFTLSGGGCAVQLTRSLAHLLTLLTIAGDVGLSVEDVKQVLFDMDRLDCSRDEPCRRPWHAQAEEPAVQDASRRTRASTLKTRANRVLSTLDLIIDARGGRGRWRIATVCGKARPLRLAGTLWDLLDTSVAIEHPVGLSPQQELLWESLVAASPGCLSLHALARALGKNDDPHGLKQTIDAIEKLNGKLDDRHARLRIVRLKRSFYGLMPTNSAPAGEVL